MKYIITRKTKGTNQYRAKRSNLRAFIFLCLFAFALIYVFIERARQDNFVTAYISSKDVYAQAPANEASFKIVSKKDMSILSDSKDLTPKQKLILATYEAFGIEHIEAMYNLIQNESGFRPDAENPSSAACGMFQAFPCEKMDCEHADANCQIEWGINYIKNRYENPTNAWEFWLSAKPINGVDHGNWY